MINNIEKMKLLLDIDVSDTSKDSLLQHYIDSATQGILNYCNFDTLEDKYNSIMLDYAMTLYKGRYYSGITKQTQGDRSISFAQGIPKTILGNLPLPKVKVM